MNKRMDETRIRAVLIFNLRKKMHERNVTQSELAQMAGISRSIMSRYMNGERTPSIKSLSNICEALDCRFDDILPLVKGSDEDCESLT